jgi:ubiquinone/menaquinone biosynthesis C-methylase UbiE
LSVNPRKNPGGEVFDRSASYYDEVRPGYPEELIEDIITLSGIPDGGRIIEVGCGTGQATLPFVQKGYEILCIDIGENLLNIARKKFSTYYKVKFVNSLFEDWTPEPEVFDLLISATAFHWIDPQIGFEKAAKTLRKNGYIALFWNLHPTPYTDFFKDVQKVYQKVVPEWRDPSEGPSSEEKVNQLKVQMDPFNLFEDFEVRKYFWSRQYSTIEYIKLLETYSDHRSLEENRRRVLYDGIREVIENKYNGVILRPYLSVLFIAKKKS